MIADKILLFRHDSQTQNVLQIINNPADVKEGCLVEVVLSGTCTAKFLALSVQMDSSFRFDTINLRWAIVYFEGSQVIVSK